MKTLFALLSLTLLSACHTTQPIARTQGKTTAVDFGKRPIKTDPNAAYKQANRPLMGPNAIGKPFQRY